MYSICSKRACSEETGDLGELQNGAQPAGLFWAEVKCGRLEANGSSHLQVGSGAPGV